MKPKPDTNDVPPAKAVDPATPLFAVGDMLGVLRMSRDMLNGAKQHWPEDRELKARTFYRWQDAVDSVSVVIADIEAMYPANTALSHEESALDSAASKTTTLP